MRISKEECKVEIRNLDLARKQFNNWQGNATIFIDLEEREAWTIVEEDINYHDQHVIRLIDKDNLHERSFKYNKEQIDQLAKVKIEKYEEGWEREELEDNYHMEFAKVIG